MIQPTALSGSELTSAGGGFLADVIAGLQARPRTLPCKYLYDDAGAALFERICGLEAYYLTAVELEIMRRESAALARLFPPGACVIELGSGSGLKTRLLLDASSHIRTYIPIDLAANQLRDNAAQLRARYPHLEVLPVVADYEQPLLLPQPAGVRTVVYFPGSTLGNAEPAAAVGFLSRLAQLAGSGGALLIGIDRKKDPAVLHAAYNDPEGVTAAFNLNLLHRINRELDGRIDVTRWRHHAAYSPLLGCIEMYLVSMASQRVQIGGHTFDFCEGDAIRTERSYKYTVAEVTGLIQHARLSLGNVHSDEGGLFSLYEIEIP